MCLLPILGLVFAGLVGMAPVESSTVADAGIADAVSGSPEALLARESELEGRGDIYAARRLMSKIPPGPKQVELLKRRARLEDFYGSDGAAAYLALMNAQLETQAPAAEIGDTCRRGVMVALRTERPEIANKFADELTILGDHSGADVVQSRRSAAESRTEILGGAEALRFLVTGSTKGRTDRIFVDYSRALIPLAPMPNSPSGPAEWQKMAGIVHEYFQHVSALASLGTRDGDHVAVLLSLKNKADKQRTEKAFDILGLKLKKSKAGLELQAGEGKTQAKRQETLAALAIDDRAIQQALAAGKPYKLEIAIDSVPVFPAVDVWQKAFYGREHFAGGLAEAFVTDARIPKMYLALNSMDRAVARALLDTVPLWTLTQRFSSPLSLFSPALAMNGKAAEVPGESSANEVWRQLTGVDPASAVPFFEALLSRDGGELMAFFYAVSQLDVAHQRFFTRSPARAQKFYELFRESPEMRNYNALRFVNGSFVEFLRSVPLNQDGSVDFPGAPEVWMVVKGQQASSNSLVKLSRKLKRAAAPDDEDEILIRLAKTEYKSQDRHDSELANFIAVTRIDEQRDEPLDPNSALLLAQGYASFNGLYTYFAEIGDLDAADYQKTFSLESKLDSVDRVTANMRLGELHSFLALMALLRQSGLAPQNDVLQVYRTNIERFSKASDAAQWTAASLAAVNEIAAVGAPHSSSREAAIRAIALGRAASKGDYRETAYQQVLALQKVPSLNALFAISNDLRRVSKDPAKVDQIQRQLSTLEVLVPPKAWRLTGESKKNLEQYRTAEAQAIAAKLREKLAKRKRNPADIEKLSDQLLAELEPWTELAVAGQIYARFLDPTDLLVSEDPMLLRKHDFVALDSHSSKRHWFTPANLTISSEGEGSHFSGGLAEFSMAAGRARAEGNRVGGPASVPLAGAIYASIRATNWDGITPASLQSFAATVRLAQEWIVESAVSPSLYRQLEQDSRGLLSLSRRKSLLEGVSLCDWPAVWESVSISDLYFLGSTLLENAPKPVWTAPGLAAMKNTAEQGGKLDLLGSVAPELCGSAQPRLRRYEPYEDYQLHFRPERLSQRLAELKLYAAWLADESAWEPNVLGGLASPAADALLSKLTMRDMWDWQGALDSYRSLKPENLEVVLNQ